MIRPTLCVFVELCALLSPDFTNAASVLESFDTNPAARWSFGIGDNLHNQFVWNSAAPPAYTGDAASALAVHLDSSLPTARFDRPLGISIGDGVDFTIGAQFRFAVTSAPSDQYMQMAFGLTNHSLTGGDRTGSLADFTSDNVFHTVEFTYYPNVSSFSGATLSPAVFGAKKGAGDAFANFASIFGPGSDLGDNTVGVQQLPAEVTLDARLTYTAATHSLKLDMATVLANGTLAPIVTEVPPLVLTLPGYDSTLPFSVDTLSIIAYHDGFTTAGTPSLVADLVFERLDFSTPVPEPAALVLLAVGSLAIACVRRRSARHR